LGWNARKKPLGFPSSGHSCKGIRGQDLEGEKRVQFVNWREEDILRSRDSKNYPRHEGNAGDKGRGGEGRRGPGGKKGEGRKENGRGGEGKVWYSATTSCGCGHRALFLVCAGGVSVIACGHQNRQKTTKDLPMTKFGR